MADITIVLTDADQALMIAQAVKHKAKLTALESHTPPRGIDVLPVHLCANTEAVWWEDKIGWARGTLQGSGSFSNYDSTSGGTDKG